LKEKVKLFVKEKVKLFVIALAILVVALAFPIWLLFDNYTDSAGAESLPNDVGLAVPRYDYFDPPIAVYSSPANLDDLCITFELIGIDEGASQITLGVLVGATATGEHYLRSIKHPPKTGVFLLSSENGLNNYSENFPLASLEDATPVSCEGGNISMSHLALNSIVAFNLNVFVLGTPRAYPNDWYELDDAATVSVGNIKIPSTLLLATRDEDYTVAASVYKPSKGKDNAGPNILEFTIARSWSYYWYIYLVASLPFVLLAAVFSFKYFGKKRPGPKPFEVAFGVAATLVAILPLRSVLIPASLPTPTRLDLYFGAGCAVLVASAIIWALVLRLGDHNDEPEEGTTTPRADRTGAATVNADEIKKLDDLRAAGILTDDEFAAIKKRHLGG